MRASERYIVWDQDSDSREYLEIHVYDLQTNRESMLATHAAWPDVSGNIAVWGEVVYDLSKDAPIQVKNQHGKPHRPRISGKWIVYLDASSGEDTADIYAHNLTTDEDFKIGTMPLLGQRIGVVGWYPVISGKNVAWVSIQDDKLHHYNLDTRTDRLLPIPLNAETVNGIPRGLQLDGDILVYELREWMGYDLARDAAFPIPIIPAVKGKWTSSTRPLVSGRRLVWQTSVDNDVHIYTTEVVWDQ
jgi:Tol biopolymer transport system component